MQFQNFFAVGFGRTQKLRDGVAPQLDAWIVQHAWQQSGFRLRICGNQQLKRQPPPARVVFVVALLYAFLVGITLLEDGIGSLGSDVQEDLFASVTNPLAGLFVGVLATVLAQSSSVTTATVVGLVGGGLIGVDEAVPIIMGANIGTTVTNTLASIGSIRRPEEFRRAFPSSRAAGIHSRIGANTHLVPCSTICQPLSQMNSETCIKLATSMSWCKSENLRAICWKNCWGGLAK